MQWIVYTYETVNGALVCHAYGPIDSKDDATSLVARLSAGNSALSTMVLELEPVPT